MDQKRIKFALFTCVFALYGCVSTSGVNPAIQKNAENKNKQTSVMTATAALNKISLLDMSNARNMQALAFEANVVHTEDANIFRKMRDTRGVLLPKGQLNQITKNLMEQAIQQKAERIAREKEEAEKKRLEEEAKNVVGTFSPRITTYGVDCYGCRLTDGRGGTAMGVALDLNLGVQMPDGSWQPGIKYGNYFIVAADPSIPMCSIVKISDHGLSGSGITPEQPYYAIVLDRGGAIQGGHLDLYIGSEQSGAIVPVMNTVPRADIIRLGGQNGNTCAL